MDKSTKQILIDARKLIDDAPDIAHGAYERNGCLCALGAICRAVVPDVEMLSLSRLKGRPVFSHVLRSNVFVSEAASYLRGHLPGSFFSVPDFNDASTKADVLKVFDDAIASIA